jgi:hypothetical protein
MSALQCWSAISVRLHQASLSAKTDCPSNRSNRNLESFAIMKNDQKFTYSISKADGLFHSVAVVILMAVSIFGLSGCSTFNIKNGEVNLDHNTPGFDASMLNNPSGDPSAFDYPVAFQDSAAFTTAPTITLALKDFFSKRAGVADVNAGFTTQTGIKLSVVNPTPKGFTLHIERQPFCSLEWLSVSYLALQK